MRLVKFAFGGVVNTGFTYLLYLLLAKFIGYQISYLIAYVVGVVFAYWFNSKFVFEVSFSWRGFFSYPIVYIVQYGLSMLFLTVLVEVLKMDEVIAPLVVAATMVPVSFLMNKLFLRRSSSLTQR